MYVYTVFSVYRDTVTLIKSDLFLLINAHTSTSPVIISHLTLVIRLILNLHIFLISCTNVC